MKDPKFDSRSCGDSAWDEAHKAALNVQRLMHRVADEIAREVRGASKQHSRDWPFTAPSPSAEVVETADSIKVLLDVPGVEQGDISITLETGTLIIEGNRKAPEVSDDNQTRRQERVYGPFKKEIKLPVEVLADQVAAEMKNGVLTVTLPKKPKPQGVKIEVKVS